MNEIVTTSRNAMTPWIFAGIELGQQNKFRRSLYVNDEQFAMNIINIVFNYFNIDFGLYNSDTHKHTVVKPRQIAMYFIREKTKLGVLKIGKLFNRDHSTVIHSTDTVEDIMETDMKYRLDLAAIEKFLC